MNRRTLTALLAATAVGALAIAPLGGTTPASGAVGGPVRTVAASWTPSLATTDADGTVEQVRQMVQCGSTMYAVGRFTQIRQGTTVYPRNNVVSFSATTGAVTAWNPNVNGQVNSIALSANCSTAYVGGTFTSVHGGSATNLAAVSTSTGALVGGFAHAADKAVNTVVRTPNGHLLVGGKFTTVNGSSSHKYLASLNPTTGADDGYAALSISGTYVFQDSAGKASKPNVTQVFNTSLSPNGTKLLATGTFTTVGGLPRRQVFMADLTSTGLKVDAWYSSEFSINCGVGHPFWLWDAGWSTDGSKVYTAATGYKPATGAGSRTTDPRAGLCDSAAAFPATSGPVSHSWINYTGCDSLFAVAADSAAVYFGGHERYADNPRGCDAAGAGAVSAPGVVGLSPSTGSVVDNPTRARGVGADDMLVTPAGLWISSDNGDGANTCGRTATGGAAPGHAGICFLPY